MAKLLAFSNWLLGAWREFVGEARNVLVGVVVAVLIYTLMLLIGG